MTSHGLHGMMVYATGWSARTRHLVLAGIIGAAAADAQCGRGGLGADGVDALETRGRLERRVDGQRRAQTLVGLRAAGKRVSDGHLGVCVWCFDCRGGRVE